MSVAQIKKIVASNLQMFMKVRDGRTHMQKLFVSYRA